MKTFAILLCFLLLPATWAQLNPVPVGTYLYANPEALEEFSGSLRVEFTTAAPGRQVVAYGRHYRKDRQPRTDTTEMQREKFKPVAASMSADGRTALFPNLAPDYYDLIVVDDRRMTLHEGIQLMTEPVAFDDEKHRRFFNEVADSLSTTTDRIGGWEAFFDSKNFMRLQTDGTDGAMFLQQMRRGEAFAESGALLQGTIHSIDICWVRRARGDTGWQVITRQQFYRNELDNDRWFRHAFVPALQGIRIGTREKNIGPINLPDTD